MKIRRAMSVLPVLLVPLLIGTHSAYSAAAESSYDAVIPIEVLPVDPMLATGELRGGGFQLNISIIAAQPAQVPAAVIVEASQDRKSSRVFALTLIAPYEKDADGKLQL